MAEAHAGEVVEAIPRLAPAPERDQHAESADVHEDIHGEIEQKRRPALRGVGDQPEQRVAGVRDAGVRQHPLHAPLAHGDHVADRHGEGRHHGEEIGPLPRKLRQPGEEDAPKAANAAALTATAMNAVTAVGAPS